MYQLANKTAAGELTTANADIDFPPAPSTSVTQALALEFLIGASLSEPHVDEFAVEFF